MRHDVSVKTEYQKAEIKFVLDNLVQGSTSLSDADLLIVKRVGSNGNTQNRDDQVDVEVWTLRKFKKHELVIVPETTQVLCQHFTASRSAVAKNMVDADSKKPMLLDGKVRANALPDSKTSCCVYWMISASDDAKKVNMQRSYVDTTCEVKMKIADTGVDINQLWSETDMPSIPVLINPDVIQAHTQLLTTDDKDVAKVLKKEADAKAAIAAKSKTAKDAKGEEGTTTDGSKRVLGMIGSSSKTELMRKRSKTK